MTDRRSGRAKKSVDYSKFAGEESDNDDDFRQTSSQPAKRKKAESTSPKSVRVKMTKDDVESCKREMKKSEKELKDNGDDVQKQRPSLSDKVLQRHLSEALKISKRNDELLSDENKNGNSLLLNGEEEAEKENSQGDKAETDLNVSSGSIVSNGKESCKEHVKETEETNLEIEDAERSDASLSESSEEDEASDWSDGDEITVKKSAGRNCKSSNGVQDEDESDWSDDDTKKKSKKPAVTKSETKKQSQKLVSPKVPQSAPVSLKSSKAPRKTTRNSIVSLGLKPGMKTPGTPCQVISSPVRLPPKGLRLGLSRKVPGKPLHSVIKVQQ